HNTESRETHSTSRGEYATALNCTITNASENTIPVSAIIPEVIEANSVRATAALMEEVRSGKNLCSSLGKISPANRPLTAYHNGIAHSGNGERRLLVNMPLISGCQSIHQVSHRSSETTPSSRGSNVPK